jgi:hypothetical protein
MDTFIKEVISKLSEDLASKWDAEFRRMLLETLPNYIKDFNPELLEDYARRVTVAKYESNENKVYLDYDKGKHFLFRYNDTLKVTGGYADDFINNTFKVTVSIG